MGHKVKVGKTRSPLLCAYLVSSLGGLWGSFLLGHWCTRIYLGAAFCILAVSSEGSIDVGKLVVIFWLIRENWFDLLSRQRRRKLSKENLSRCSCLLPHRSQKHCLVRVTYDMVLLGVCLPCYQHLAKWCGKAKGSIPAQIHSSRISAGNKTEEDYMVLSAGWPMGCLPPYVQTIKNSGPQAITHQHLTATLPYAVWWLHWGWSLMSGVRKFSSATINSISSSWKSALSTQGSQSALCPCHMYIFACSLAM